jgi:hypothetical protein
MLAMPLDMGEDDRLHEVNKLAEIMSSDGGEFMDSVETLDNTIAPGILLLRCLGALQTRFSFKGRASPDLIRMEENTPSPNKYSAGGRLCRGHWMA